MNLKDDGNFQNLSLPQFVLRVIFPQVSSNDNEINVVKYSVRHKLFKNESKGKLWRKADIFLGRRIKKLVI